MWIDQVTPDDVGNRARVQQLAPSDPDGALKMSRTIRHPWYRCQALAAVAEHTSSIPKKLKILDEAFDPAQMPDEINRQVTVSSWPLRVLASVDTSAAELRLLNLVAQAGREPHPLRRADALYSLATAVHESRELVPLVSPSLVSTLLEGRGWRIDRLIRNTIQLGIDPKSVDQLMAHHWEGREKRKLLEALEKSSAVRE